MSYNAFNRLSSKVIRVWRNRFDLLMVLLLLMALVSTGVTGLLADYLGIPRSLFHRFSAYSLVTLASWHVIVNLGRLWARLRKAVRARSRPMAPVAQPEPQPSALSRRGFFVSAGTGLAGFALGRWLPLGPGADDPDLGQVYHQRSKPGFESVMRTPFQWGVQPPLYKPYPAAGRVSLPGPVTSGGMPLADAIQQRRSIREYSEKPLTMDQLSFLLHAAYGITEPSYPFRATPSAGGLYPLEVYPVALRVVGLANGAYHYRPLEHALDTIKEEDLRTPMLTATGGQDMVLEAAVMVVISAIFQRTRWRYHERSYRYVMLEAGHMAQNLYLAATALGLGACAIGAFFDDEVNRIIEVDGQEEATLYLVSIGTL